MWSSARDLFFFMSEVIVIGGGLAGLAAAAALGSAGHSVTLFEGRPFPGGRATSYEIGTAGAAELIDNCQHILLRCCGNLLDFYKRLGVEKDIEFHRELPMEAVQFHPESILSLDDNCGLRLMENVVQRLGRARR